MLRSTTSVGRSNGGPAATASRCWADLCGHGVGRSIHEAPQVSSVEDRDDPTILWEGLVLAIEPFLAMGATHTVTADDGWTLLTDNGGLTAQFEHTVVVTDGHPLVLTASAA